MDDLKFHIRNFKNLADTTLDVSAPFTLLLGRNGSGKSNVVEALSVYSQVLAHGASAADIDAKGIARGGASGSIRDGTQGFTITGPSKATVEVSKDSAGAVAVRSRRVPDEHAAAIRLFDLKPDAMRQWEGPEYAWILRDGRGLSRTLRSLSVDRKRLVLDAVSDLPPERIEEILFDETVHTNETMLMLSMGGRLVEARRLSDGTLRALALATLVESEKPGTILIIEDLDSGLHPSRTKSMVRHMRNRAADRGLHILATTHDTVAMNSLDATDLESVHFAVPDPDHAHATRLVKLGALTHWETLIAGSSLGRIETDQLYASRLAPDFLEQLAEAWRKQLEPNS